MLVQETPQTNAPPTVEDLLRQVLLGQSDTARRMARVETRLVNLMKHHDLNRDGLKGTV